MKSKPYVGQKVRLNRLGVETLFEGRSYMMTKILTIASVDDGLQIPMDDGLTCWIITVDDPEINQSWLNNHFVDQDWSNSNE